MLELITLTINPPSPFNLLSFTTMTPSPTPATSSAVSTMITPAHGAQERPQQQGGPPSPTKPPMPKRRKKEITLFQKNPSRPFALAQMQAANGKGPATSSSVLGTGPRFSRPQPSSNPTLGVPTTKPQQSQSQQLNSRSPSASSTPPPAPQSSAPEPSPSANPPPPQQSPPPLGAQCFVKFNGTVQSPSGFSACAANGSPG